VRGILNKQRKGIRGRGSTGNPVGRFERLEVIPEEALPSRVETQYLRDDSRSIVAHNDSPDVPFSVSINPYRGCEHGCTYCYARTYHEYLGYSAGLDFETRILVKEQAPHLLRSELNSPGWVPRVLGISGVTDPYQPIERHLQLTRACLQVLVDYRNPAALITKNALVTRDIDLLIELARHDAVGVALSITSLDPQLSGQMEPRTSSPRHRLAALERLSARGIPCGVSLAPVIPGLTDHEIPQILKAAADHGATWANWLLLRLPGAVEGIFTDWLDRALPDRADKILNRIRHLRGGALSDSQFGRRTRGEGIFAEQIRALFDSSCQRLGLRSTGPELSTAAFRRPGGHQLDIDW
jgi:DNA repair photolyase